MNESHIAQLNRKISELDSKLEALKLDYDEIDCLYSAERAVNYTLEETLRTALQTIKAQNKVIEAVRGLPRFEMLDMPQTWREAPNGEWVDYDELTTALKPLQEIDDG